MNFNFNNPGCGCGANRQSFYGTNMWNVNGNTPGNQQSCGHQQACNGCIDIVKGTCLLYTGANQTSTGINQNDDFNTVVQKLNAIKAIQDTKNANILAALNDINDRINTLAGGTPHPPYTLI